MILFPGPERRRQQHAGEEYQRLAKQKETVEDEIVPKVTKGQPKEQREHIAERDGALWPLVIFHRHNGW